MAVASTAMRLENANDGLVPEDIWLQRRRKRESSEERTINLEPEELEELEIAKFCRKLLSVGVEARKPYDVFDRCWNLYVGDMWPLGLPRWKAKITLNKIRAFIHFMQAVMTDNKPRVNIKPIVKGSEEAAKLLEHIIDREWDVNDVQDKLSLSVLWGLIWGTGFLKITWNPRKDGGRGALEIEPVVPYRIWVNATATCIEDAEFIIHVERRTLGWVYRNFPKKAALVRDFRGSRIITSGESESDRDYIREGMRHSDRAIELKTAMTMNGQTVSQSKGDLGWMRELDDWEVEVGEFWFRDDKPKKFWRQKIVNGKPQTVSVVDEYNCPILQPAGTEITPSPLNGQPFVRQKYKPKMKPVLVEDYRPEFPNGRVVLMAGPVVLRDIPNPYRIDGFPFASWKDQDVGAFWGQGEALGLKDANVTINRIVGTLYDNLNLAGNTSWLVQKDSGLNVKTLRNRPASIIPVDDVKSVQALETKSLPPQFMELYQLLKGAMSEIAGINDQLMGASPVANTAFATIDSMTESSAAILRMKVRNMEKMIKRTGRIMVQLTQQYDVGNRPVRQEVDAFDEGQAGVPIMFPDGHEREGEVMALVPPASSVEVQFKSYSKAMLQGPVEFSVVPDSSLSVSPVGMWNRYVTLWDKKLIDLQGFHEKMQLDDWRNIVKRMAAMQMVQQQMKGKPGPKPQPTGARNQRSAPAPQNNNPSAIKNSMVR
jgi:hypothetical protein